MICWLCTHLPSCSMVTPGTLCTRAAWRPILTPPKSEHDHRPSSRRSLPKHRNIYSPLMQISLEVQTVDSLYRVCSGNYIKYIIDMPELEEAGKTSAHLDLWPCDCKLSDKILHFCCLAILRIKQQWMLHLILHIQPGSSSDTFTTSGA